MFSRFLIVVLLGSLLACKQEKKTENSGSPVSVGIQRYNSKKCVKDSLCAEINFAYPVLSGGANPDVVRMINDSIQLGVRALAEANPNLPLTEALDTAMQNLYALLEADYKFRGDDMAGMSYSNELECKTILQNNRFLSFEMNTGGFTGGAHGYYATVLLTYDLSTGKLVDLHQFIADTSALRPLLEKAFVDDKKDYATELKLSDLLLEPEQPLALPANCCVVQEGIRFVYNPYEVAPYAVGITDFTLTWEQLGVLSDRKKWLD